MSTLLNSIISLLFPCRCIGCSAHGTALCERCIETIPHATKLTGSSIVAVYDYRHPIVSLAIRQLKYHRKSEIGYALIQAAIPYIHLYIEEIVQGNTFCLVPIPQHSSKTRERGFNQSEIIAHMISNNVSCLLRKIRPTRPQAQIKNRNERYINIRNTMTVTKPIDPIVTYILIDDVTTTGSTFAEAKRALLKAGARTITGIAIAQG
jgi:ComF family protein